LYQADGAELLWTTKDSVFISAVMERTCELRKTIEQRKEEEQKKMSEALNKTLSQLDEITVIDPVTQLPKTIDLSAFSFTAPIPL